MVYKEAVNNREVIADIKYRYLSGQITREQAKLESEPIIKRINRRGQVIAQKHKVKYYPVDFINLMR